jgi:hypothetical protein
MDSQKRIKELEEQVQGLEAEVKRLRPVPPSGSSPSDSGITPPSRRWLFWDLWASRMALVFTAGVVIAATVVGYREEALTVAQALNLGRDVAAIPSNYRLLACAMVTALAVLSYLLKRRGLFIASGLAAVYLTYVLCLSVAAVDRFRFWFPFSFLTVSYVLFSSVCVLEGRRPGTGRRRRLAILAAGNSLVYFVLAWAAVSAYVPDRAWVFRVWFTAVLVGFTVLAETSGHRRNYLFQLFAAKAVLMFVFTLEAFLTGQLFWIATSAACIALAIAYRLTGIVVLKAINLFLLLVTFMGVFRALRMADSPAGSIAPFPENWLIAGVAASMCLLLAWFYEHVVHPGRPKPARISGHWFLAGTRLDVPGATASMLHAAAGALILLTLTILEIETHETLAWVLALEAVALAVVGLALFTPQIEVAGLLVLVGAHVTLGFHLLQDVEPLAMTEQFTWSTALIVCATYWSAYRWERYLRRVKGGGPWEHYIAASIPYVLCTGLLSLLAARQFSGIPGLALQSLLGIGVFVLGWRLKRPAIKLAGLGALALGAMTHAREAGSLGLMADASWQPMVHFGVLLATYVGGERLIRILEVRGGTPAPGDGAARTSLVFMGTALAMLLLHQGMAPDAVTLAWAAVPAVAIALGAATGDRRYAWAALAALCCMAARTFWSDLSDWRAFFWYASLMPTACLFGVALWMLRRAPPAPTPGSGPEAGPDVDNRHVR